MALVGDNVTFNSAQSFALEVSQAKSVPHVAAIRRSCESAALAALASHKSHPYFLAGRGADPPPCMGRGVGAALSHGGASRGYGVWVRGPHGASRGVGEYG